MVKRFRLGEAEKGEKFRRKRAPANRKQFTPKSVSTLKPKRDRQYLVWDEGTGAARGLAILVSPTGTKSYRAVYYYPGSPKPHYVNIGRVGELVPGDSEAEIEKARLRCRQARSKAKRGEDPRAGDASSSGSFETMLNDWTKHHQLAKRGNTSADETRTVLGTVCADWLALPIATIRPQQIEKLLWRIRDGDGDKRARPYLANRVHAHLKGLFAWCACKGGPLTESPMAGMEKPWDKEKPRDLPWFKGAEADKAIKAIWAAAYEIGGDEERFLKLLLLTGKRRGTIAAMQWEQIDDTWFWNAPPSTSKNKRTHPVPLSTLAQRVLGRRQERGRVFTLKRLKSLQERVRELTGLGDFIFHGLRHIAETKLGELRVPPHVRDLLFDHAPARGAGAGYDHGAYRDQMRAAVETWADHVGRVTGCAS
jgi:integrase